MQLDRSRWPLLAVAVLSVPSWSQTTELISVHVGGAPSNGDSTNASVSADGRFVAFQSHATNLVASDVNAVDDIFVRDRGLGTTICVSLDLNGNSANDLSWRPAISADGRYVAFYSNASDLVLGDSNGIPDVFVRRLPNGPTELVSISTGGAQQNNYSMAQYPPAISADGQVIAFVSLASNLVGSDTNSSYDVFVRDLTLGTTERVSVGNGMLEANNTSNSPSISADGRYVGFSSLASNLVAGDLNSSNDVFLHDTIQHTTELVSATPSGVPGGSSSEESSISADGRFVAFVSAASNLVTNDTNFTPDVFVRDRHAAVTRRVSVTSTGAQANSGGGNHRAPPISADGRFVAFVSQASNLGTVNVWKDVFVRNRAAETTETESVDSSGIAANNNSESTSMSADGRYLAFESLDTNLVSPATSGSEIFLRDRGAGSTDSGFCFGDGSLVTPCPCGNSGTGPNGCASAVNAAGAHLAVTGAAIPDSIVLAGSGMPASVTCIYLQGDADNVIGAVFGDGVRCVDGTLIRLRTKTNVGGASQFPDVGDPSVSTRGAVTPGSGAVRYYQTYYRNAAVAFCPPATFNVTNGWIVTW